jgi:hypothetical protein
MGLAGCAPPGVPISPHLGDANLPRATELATTAVTPPGLSQLGTRISAGCGVTEDAPLFGEDRPREYGCTVSAVSASALPGAGTARAALAATEQAMEGAGCISSGPASDTLSGEDLSSMDADPASSYVQEGYTCGPRQVLVRLGRADSAILQEDTDRLSDMGGGASVRDDPRLDLAALSSALEAEQQVAPEFVAVISARVGYLTIHACGSEVCDVEGNPAVPDTAFPIAPPLPPVPTPTP